MEKILVAEDDESVRAELTRLLCANGYRVVSEPPCDMALLDVNLPGESGYEICRRLRTQWDIPVIFLTGRDSAEDELLGFGVGADDYIRKPYNSAVLLARIARLLKRKGRSVMTARDLTLNLAELTVYRDGQSRELTKNETRILACLMEKGLCAKEELIEDLWQNSLYVDENTLYVNINRLREKLAKLGAGDYIRTVRGVGYRL
ncbi:MAG: response regulator transcription factor [Lachnospiraceae bacterium]|jgi:two-component system response regulator protein BraR/BceR|nr:response regulator transcription factor [Lachnospiraceae bacterium]